MAETGEQHGPVLIGIDLGTACSGVAVRQNGRAEVVTNGHGGRATPSYVAFTDTEGLVVGDAAKSQASRNPTNTVFGTKRLMGRRFCDASVQAGLKLWPFKVVAGRGDKPMVAANYKGKQKLLAAEEVASMLLSKMKAEAEAYLGCPVKNAVITVPASFDVVQRRATKDACAIAGLDVLGVIHEPTAAAVAYGLHESANDKNVLVFDLGGSHASVSLLAVASGKIAVMATAGDPCLGGEDFNGRMVEHFIAKFKAGHRKDVSRNARAMVRLRAACEQAKRTLSSASWAAIELECFHEGTDFYSTITRDQFEDLNLDLFCKCMEPIKKCLMDAKMDRRSVDDIVLVGGSTRIPRVRRLIQDLFDGKELRKDINPDEAAARGAATIASRGGGDSLLDLFLPDATPRSIGVEEAGGAMAVVIPENTAIPVRETKRTISVQPHHKKGVVVSVFEGEKPRARDNTLFCELELPGAHRGAKPGAKLPVSVCFSVDADGVLTVSASDKVNGHKKQMRFMEQSQLRKKEIERMAKEAKYMAEDEGNKERIKAKNSLEEFLYKKRRAIEDEKRKVDDALCAVEEMIQKVPGDQVSSAGELSDALKKLMIE
ncbi:heat shock cognate 70 kDa protein-like [Oryza brachyantha]|uniref:heat shock cognate 70 kDa protein-like n=1 Tax=Oryza brachyantha TaxID=4533 RepID=UPI0007764E9F|nr:heat shock cognate 70 kDa protein-like [Oryza brachyantha]